MHRGWEGVRDASDPESVGEDMRQLPWDVIADFGPFGKGLTRLPAVLAGAGGRPERDESLRGAVTAVCLPRAAFPATDQVLEVKSKKILTEKSRSRMVCGGRLDRELEIVLGNWLRVTSGTACAGLRMHKVMRTERGTASLVLASGQRRRKLFLQV